MLNRELPLPERLRLGDLLVDGRGRDSRDELAEESLAAQRSIIGSRRRLGHVLVDLGLATERQIADALADQLGLEVADLTKVAIAPEVVRLLPRGVAQRLGVIVVARTADRLTVAVTDPTDVVALDDVRLHTGASELTVLVATESQVRDHLTRVWSLSEDSTDVTTYFDDIELASPEQDDGTRRRRRADRAAGQHGPRRRRALRRERHPPRAAARDAAGPLPRRRHPARRHVRAAQRDGLRRQPAQDRVRPGHRRAPAAAGRADPDHRSTASTSTPGSSTLPSIHGEKVVIRLLARADQVPPLDGLGLEPDQLARPAARPVVAAGTGADHRPDRRRQDQHALLRPRRHPLARAQHRRRSRTRSRCRWPGSPRSRCTSAAG